MKSLKNKKLFLFDIDGTIALGDTLFEGTRELLSYIESIHGKVYYITNNSTKSGQDYVNRFQDVFHLESVENQFITSGYMTICFLKEQFSGRKIYVMGTSSFRSELERNGLIITEKYELDIACLVVAYDSELTYPKLIETCKVLSLTNAPFYATNPDLCCPIDFGFIPDCGALCEMITQSTGKEPIYLGKPNAEVVSLCLQDSGFTKEETLVIGDRLYTDIACGINAGVDTCVLYSGEAKPEDIAHTNYPPSYCFSDIKALFNACNA